MPPSSSPCDGGAGDGLLGAVLARGPVAGQVSDRAWLQAMLDVEAALARGLAGAGIIADADADAIAAACDVERYDVAAIARDAAASGIPVVPLVRALTAAVHGPAAAHVHRGATSQDVLDSAAMLVARRSLDALLGDLAAACAAAVRLAEVHRDTAMAGRTLLQQALPTTFGLKAAGWLVGLDEASARLDDVRRTRLAVQLGGAAGTLASLGAVGTQVLGLVARELGLAEPVLPWHTIRTRHAELAAALGETAGVVAKVAGDVTLLAQTEVAEVSEGGPPSRGGSSTLPHKRNPVAAVSSTAAAAQAPGLVATLMAAMGGHHHERAAGAWHAEWRPFSELLRSVGSAVAWLADCLAGLQVHPASMRANLALTGGLLLAERVVTELTPMLGRLTAHDVVARAAAATADGRAFDEALLAAPEVAAHLDPVRVARLLDPEAYLGSAGAFVDRALAAHRTSQWTAPRGGA